MITTLDHPKGRATVTEGAGGRRRVEVELNDPGAYMPHSSCETAYPLPLIERVLAARGPAMLCYSLRREEHPHDVQAKLRYAILAYVTPEQMAGKRLLDFGCGSGASTMILARMLPDTTIVATDINAEEITTARMRQQHYGFENLSFVVSERGDDVPHDLGQFDYICLSALYEHLLPNERTSLVPKIWSLLAPGGVLFLDQTPHRYYPYESHTTGLPLINYLPEGLAFPIARRFSRRVPSDASKEQLYRAGIHGATQGEVVRNIALAGEGPPVVMTPRFLGAKDQVDVWFLPSMERRPMAAKHLMRATFRGVSRLTGSSFVPSLTLALQKPDSGAE